MFTGLVQSVGQVAGVERSTDGARVQIATELAGELTQGDSVAVNGVCLTATAVNAGTFSAEAVNETLQRSALGELETGAEVNLELALRVGDRLGGHMVQGHVDAVGVIEEVGSDGFARQVRIGAEPGIMRYVIEKGSIAVDGVSLTVAETAERSFTVSVIPETLERTTFGAAEAGRKVNLEVDVLAKYVEKLLPRGDHDDQ